MIKTNDINPNVCRFTPLYTKVNPCVTVNPYSKDQDKFVLTRNGELKIKHFINDCEIKRKKMLENDLDELTQKHFRPISKETILESINEMDLDDVEKIKEFTKNYRVTDHYFQPLHLVYGTDFVTREEVKKINHILQKQKLSCVIVEVFEEFLDQKGIEIPCEDSTEEDTRHFGGNNAKLYGTEYWDLIDQIHRILLADDKERRK